MAISYRQRGKKKTWDYRIFDKNKVVVASNSGFKTKKEAMLEATKIELDLLHGNVVDTSVTLYQLWKNWYRLQVEPLNKSDSSTEQHYYRGRLILEHFKDTPAMSIRASDYQEFINAYAERACSATVRRVNSEIRKVVRFAKRDKLAITDFTESVMISGKVSLRAKTERAITSTKDYHILLTALKENMDKHYNIFDYLLFVQLKTGLRVGELVGLTWDCVLLDSKEIHTYRRYDVRRHEWRPPKTKTSVRKVPVDSETLAVLLDLQSTQSEDLNRSGITNIDNHVFYSSLKGVPSNQLINRYLRKMLKKLNIPPYNLSATGIRHTYASILLAYGIDIWVIAENMGHKDISQITKTYGHLMKETSDRENTRIRDFLSKANQES